MISYLYRLILTRCILGALGALICVPGVSSKETPGPMTYAQIKDLIRAYDIRSLDQLLPYLPKELRQNYALVFATRSVQPASVKSPRVVFFSPDGSIGFGFATADPTNLEILEMNPQTKKIEPRMIAFGADASQKTRFVDDPLQLYPKGHPKNCTNCHGQQLHFNWNSYPRWPGVFGQSDKGNNPKIKEALALKQLQSEIDDTSLLRHLPGVKTVSLKTLGERNVEITDQLSRSNTKRVMELLKENPQFMKRRAAWFAAFEGSDNFFKSFLTEEELLEYEKRFPELERKVRAGLGGHYDLMEKLQSATAYPMEETAQIFQKDVLERDLGESRRLARAQFLAEQMGISTEDWWLTRERGTYSAASGQYGLQLDLRNEIFEELRRTDPEIIGTTRLPDRPFLVAEQVTAVPKIEKVRDKVFAETGEKRALVPSVEVAGAIRRVCHQFFSEIVK